MAAAERAVRAARARVTSQAEIVEAFEIAGDEQAAEQAGETLALI